MLTNLDLFNNRLCNVWYGNVGTRRGDYNASGITALAEALKVNKVLTTLYLSDNQLGPEGSKSIAQAISVSASLTQVLAFLPSRAPDSLTYLAH